MNARKLATKQLQLHMRHLNRRFRVAVSRQKKIAAELQRHDLTPLCVSDEQVAQLSRQVSSQLCYLAGATLDHGLNHEESQCQQRLRECADKQGWVLPLDAMVKRLQLSAFERDAILICLAPELHRAYGRILAYIHDDLTAQLPTVGLLCSLFAATEEQWLQHRHALSVHGRLRRLGLLLTHGDTVSQLQQVCRIAPGVLERLDTSLSIDTWQDQFYDLDEIDLDSTWLDIFPQDSSIESAATALKHGEINLLALWGESMVGVDAAVQATALLSGRALLKLPLQTGALTHTLAKASYLNAVIWIDADRLFDDQDRQLPTEILRRVLPGSTPLIISGKYPWRPTELLTRRDYHEIQLSEPDQSQRTENWQHLLPTLPNQKAQALAQRFRLAPQAQLAVKRAATVRAKMKSNGVVGSAIDQLDDMCRLVSQTQASRFTQPVTPKRGREDLVLSSALYNQVLEVASFYQTLMQVDEQWGFGHLATGAGGIKALFAGDSGTGKTLAAEVIAAEVGLSLLKIDLSQVVSKWVGETEKNIDAAFCEAETNQAVLFFDEADTLFGKRGEVQQGSDRYANLEVGYLLQRLEQFSGLVILASNLKDEIDEAFTRRFQVVLHFPRPAEQERLRLWKMAFPAAAPVDASVDVSSLVHLDMTGAGIFNACHTAGLLAANEGSDVICHHHIIEGIARQYHRESRVIGPTDLKRFSQQSPVSMHSVSIN